MLLQPLWGNTSLKYYMKPFLHNHRVQQFNLISSRGSHLVHLSSDHFLPMEDPGEGLAPPPLIFRPNWGPKGEKKFFGDCTPPPPPPPPPMSRCGSGTAFCQFFSVCCAWLLLSGLDALSTLSCAQQQLCLCWSCTPNIRYFHSTGNFPAISDDLVNSYHLLLCCLDLLYSNALYTKNRQNLLNPNFEGNF